MVASIAVGGCAAQAATSGSTVSACTASAYRAIQRHEVLTAVPAACDGLSRAQVNQAASTAIRQASGSGPKSVWRSQAASAAPWVKVLISGPAPAAGGVPPGASAGGGTGGSLLGRGSELAVQIAALIAWLITAASGGYVLVHWLRAGGRLRRRAATAVPPAVLLGHPALGLLGLVLWTVFVATGWVALAWVATGLLAPVAGLGMAVLVIGLPSPRPAAGELATARAGPVPAGTAGTTVLVAPPVAAAPARSRGRQPVLAIALHGLFAATLLLLVITAAVGAG
jgi:hypothetical protein